MIRLNGHQVLVHELVAGCEGSINAIGGIGCQWALQNRISDQLDGVGTLQDRTHQVIRHVLLGVPVHL